MKMLSSRGMDTFNRLLKEWRAEGQHIGWAELSRAADLAREAEEAEEAERMTDQHVSPGSLQEKGS